MTTPNRIVFQATGQPAKDGEYVLSSGGMLAVDSLGTQSVRHNNPAYRRIDAPADSRLLDVATKLACAALSAIDSDTEVDEESMRDAVKLARALIAACEGAAQ